VYFRIYSVFQNKLFLLHEKKGTNDGRGARSGPMFLRPTISLASLRQVSGESSQRNTFLQMSSV